MSEKKTAEFVTDLAGDARLYKVKPKMGKFTYVVVSAAVVPFSGPETYIFGANKDGEVTEWGELDGSYRGGLDHDRALKNAGYEVR